MKTILLLLAVLLSSCAEFPIKGKVCYDTPQGKVCLASEGKGVEIEANITSGK